MLQHVEIIARFSNQATLHAEVANGPLKLALGRFQLCAGGSDIGFHRAYLRLHTGHVTGHRSDLLFLLFRKASFRFLLFFLQGRRARGQLLLRHAHF